MKRAKGFARPYVFRDFELIRAGPDGTYWKAVDGMVVRMAAPERGQQRAREAESLETSLAVPENVPGPVGAW